ncbi:MAG: EF-P lysine aminoacylase EpmA [Alphaproteobacteria bacterium]
MQWWKPELYMKNAALRHTRQTVIQTIRKYLMRQGLIEVDTPTLQPAPSDEVHLKCFQAGDFYLQTSPELAMKKLLVAGEKAIFQICHAYRDEPVSDTHSPEFTMLEWYRAGTDYHAMMKDSIALVRACCKACGVKELRHNERICNPFGRWQKITVAAAFKKYAGINLWAKDLRGEAERIGIQCADSDTWEDIFFRIMLNKVEDKLGDGVPCILCEYPTQLGALARTKPGHPEVCERFEIYAAGVELCNAFSELTDAKEQRERFQANYAERKRLYGWDDPMDEDFLQALEYGMPKASGNALGVDRLIMLISGAEKLADTQWVPCQRN